MANLLYRWKLDEGSGQTSVSAATANTATLYTTTPGDLGVSWTPSGYRGAGLTCDGTAGTGLGASTAVQLTRPPVDFCVCCWFKTTALTNYPMVACVPVSNAGYGIAIWTAAAGSNGKVCAGIYVKDVAFYDDDSSAVINYADGNWHHAAFGVRSSDGKKTLFVDCGVEEDDAIPAPAPVSIAENAYWRLGGGSYFNAGNGAFNGTVDDIRIYDGYMTAAEVCDVMLDFDVAARQGRPFIFSGGIA